MERWICPFCNFAQMIGDDGRQDDRVLLKLQGGLPSQSGYATQAYACGNPQCRRISLTFDLFGFVSQNGMGAQRVYQKIQVLPRSSSKPQPDYIPLALREDYEEACAIRDLSPKAAATLVRRCLQGMIRDFCNIVDKPTLHQEIKALKDLIAEGRAPSGVNEETVEAIDQVRGIGNIGAHMEKQIDLIVDVDPNEAQLLIELVEMLFKDWYVARHERQERLRRIKETSQMKAEAKKGVGSDDSVAAPEKAAD